MTAPASPPPPMPLVGDIALGSVQQIDHVMSSGFQRIAVPGLDGDVLQRAGRGSHAIWIRGLLSGETALAELGKLQRLAADGTEVPFSADITVALELEQVVVSDLRAQAVAGTADLVGYELCLVESPPLPPPAEVSGFGGLDDFGIGDLGFDADIMGDLADLASDVAGAVDAVMEVADQLTALASLADLDVGGPLQPMADAVSGVVKAAGTFDTISASLTELLGGAVMTALGFGATATIGSLRYTGGIAAVRVALSIGPGVGSARLTMPRDLRVDAAPGDDVAIALRGEGDETDVFTGKVVTVRRALDRTVVVCGDAAVALAAIRTGSTFEHQGASAVIDAFAREAGVEVGTVDLDLDLASYVADQGRTAWEHVTALAAWGGALATTAADGAVEVRPFPSPPADLALRYGREIAELGVTTVAPAASVVWTGSGPAGDASDPTAQLQTTATLPDDAPGPDAHTIRVAAPALRTPAAASSAIEAAAARNGAPRLVAACWLVPGLRAGTAVEIADAPTPESTGPWLITRVVHTVGPGPAGRTTFEAVSMQSSGSSLLDQLIGAVGSLL